MPTPDEIKKQKELNDLLEQENRILREKLKLQSDGYDLSSTLIENLKEILGIESRRSTFDAGVLDINKKINRAIRDQKLEFEDIKGIQKQIQKNSDLVIKTKLFETSLEKSISNLQKKKADNYLKEVDIAANLNKQIAEELAKAEKGEQIDGRRLGGLKGRLTQTLNILNAEEKSLGFLAKQYVYTKQQRAELEKINKEREKEAEKIKDLDKKLGITSGLFKGLSKTPFLKDLGIDFTKALEEARKKTDETGNGVAGLAAGLKSVGTQFKEAITNSANLTLAIMRQLYLTFINIDKQTGNLAKSFNITYLQANELRKSLTGISLSTRDTAVNTRTLQESLIAVGSTLGSNAELNQKDLVAFTQMREKAGLTNVELVEMQKLTYVSGVNLEDNVGSLLASAKITGLNNKMLLNEKDIMRDVVKTSNAIKLSLGGQGKELGHAAAQVKVLGMSMSQVENIAGSLLNFEQSISAELEAELLTGKDLNLENARLYAINNDIAGVAREIRKNYGDTAEFAKLNRIQQEAAAKAVGMSREDLAKTLTDEKALQGLNGEKRNAAQAALEFARAQGMTEGEIGKRSIDDLLKQQSVQERLNLAVEKLKESFVVIAEVLVPIFDGFADLVGWLASSKVTLAAIAVITGAIATKSIITAIANIFGSSAKVLGPLGAIAGGITTGIMFANIDSAEGKVPTTRGNDVISPPPGYGKRTLFGPEGKIHLNDRDTILAGTDLNQNTINKPMSSQSRLEEMIKIQQNQISEMMNFQRSQSQKPIYVSAKINDKELLSFNANNANERGNLEKRTAYNLQ
jgi:hypothetical protein